MAACLSSSVALVHARAGLQRERHLGLSAPASGRTHCAGLSAQHGVGHQWSRGDLQLALGRQQGARLPRRRIHGISAKQAVAEPPQTAEGKESSFDYDCVVVGGGISGLCTAQALLTDHAERFPRVLVTEAREARRW